MELVGGRSVINGHLQYMMSSRSIVFSADHLRTVERTGSHIIRTKTVLAPWGFNSSLWSSARQGPSVIRLSMFKGAKHMFSSKLFCKNSKINFVMAYIFSIWSYKIVVFPLCCDELEPVWIPPTLPLRLRVPVDYFCLVSIVRAHIELIDQDIFRTLNLYLLSY